MGECLFARIFCLGTEETWIADGVRLCLVGRAMVGRYSAIVVPVMTTSSNGTSWCMP